MKRTAAIAGLLALVASAASAQIDNYQCYKAKDLKQPKFVATSVSLSDQFTPTAATLKKPAYVCNPTSLNGSTMINPTTHLNCYRHKTVAYINGPNVQTTDMFGTLEIDTKRAKFFCVPSSKTITP